MEGQQRRGPSSRRYMRRKRRDMMHVQVCLVLGVLGITWGVSALTDVSRLHLESFPGASLDQSQRRKLLAVANGTLEINCTEPAIHQFPTDVFSNSQRRQGAVVLHIVAAMYMFFALAIVCDDYFVVSLEKICEKLSLTEDVAGATFMATGSSAPELFASIIGVFITHGDVGVGTIVGSAVFNILCIVGVCSLFAGQVVHLTKYAVFRDSFCYTLSVLALMAFIYDGRIMWWESLVLVFMYVGYILVMKFNSSIQRFFTRGGSVKAITNGNAAFNPDDYSFHGDGNDPTKRLLPEGPANKMTSGEEGNHEQALNSPFRIPGSPLEIFKWLVSWPILFLLFLTLPDVNQPRWEKYYLVSFFGSTVWIAVFSYVMVWMVTVVGFTLGIPDVIMGITFLAAGTSVPDCMASLLVARQGQGDMAVSNSLGSNVFDILIGLGVPWSIQTLAVSMGSQVLINSRGLFYSVVLLLGSVTLAVLGIHVNGWRLDTRLGVYVLLLYVIFLTISILIEYNVFTFINLPMCLEG
ncbi:unnamed protein product [Gadus morhua 'NCC']